MRRFFSVVLAAAAVLALSAGPAAADQALKLGQGPPLFSGDFEGNGALVLHCNAFGAPGAFAFTPGGDVRGNCPGGD